MGLSILCSICKRMSHIEGTWAKLKWATDLKLIHEFNRLIVPPRTVNSHLFDGVGAETDHPHHHHHHHHLLEGSRSFSWSHSFQGNGVIFFGQKKFLKLSILLFAKTNSRIALKFLKEREGSILDGDSKITYFYSAQFHKSHKMFSLKMWLIAVVFIWCVKILRVERPFRTFWNFEQRDEEKGYMMRYMMKKKNQMK